VSFTHPCLLGDAALVDSHVNLNRGTLRSPGITESNAGDQVRTRLT
jgi:hypothetical protein